jgi:hypothetical protein
MLETLKVDPKDWKLGEFPINPQAWSIRYYSTFVIIVYVIVLFVLDFISDGRILCRMTARGVTRLGRLAENLKKKSTGLRERIVQLVRRRL